MLRNKVSQTFIENRSIDFEAFHNFMFEGIRGEACSGCRATPSPCQCTTACPACWPGHQIRMSSSDRYIEILTFRCEAVRTLDLADCCLTSDTINILLQVPAVTSTQTLK